MKRDNEDNDWGNLGLFLSIYTATEGTLQYITTAVLFLSINIAHYMVY